MKIVYKYIFIVFSNINTCFINRLACAFVCLCLCLPLPLNAQPPEPKHINIVAPEFWCPFSCKANSPREGFSIEIAKAVFKESGISVNYVNMPYDRALLEVRRGGKVQAVVPTFKAEAPDFIYPKSATSATEYCFYVNHDSPWKYKGLDSAKQISFLGTSGYIYSPEMDVYIKKNAGKKVHLLIGENIPERMHKMLVNNRYDAFLEDTRLIDYLLSNNELSGGIKKAGCLGVVNFGFLALTPRKGFPSVKFAEYFDFGMMKIRSNGVLSAILEKYGVEDWQ